MAIVLSGVNNNDRISASDGTLDLISGVTYSGEVASPSFKVGNNIQLGNAGIVTATTFVGNVTGNINNSILLLQTGGTERIRIDSSGRVLIGTTTEGYVSADDLTVATTGSTGITIRSGTGSLGTIAYSDGTSGDAEYRGYLQYAHDVDALKIGTAGAEKVRITSAGDVGIGHNAPDASYGTNLNVHSTGGNTGARIKLSDGTSGTGNVDGFDLLGINGRAYVINRENYEMIFSTNNAVRMRINSGGQVNIGNNITQTSKQFYVDGTAEFTSNITCANQVYINGVAPQVVFTDTNQDSDYTIKNDGGQLNFIDRTNSDTTRLFVSSGGFGGDRLYIANDIVHTGDTDTKIEFGTDTINFDTGGSERLRIDSNGRLLVGTTSTSSSVRAVFQGYHGGGDDYQARVQFQTNQATNLAVNQHLANLLFTNSSGSVGAEIRAIADGAWGTNDYPGRLEFYTTPDGSNTSTERLRITSDGKVVAGGSGAGYPSRLQSHGAGNLLDLNSTSGACVIRFYESGSGRFDIRTNNGSSGLNFYDSLNGVERFRIGSAGQLGVGSTSYYGQAGDCLVSGGGSVGVAYTAIPNIFDTSNQAIADFGKMKIKFKTVAVSGTGNVHLGLCRGGVPGNCPAGEIGIPIGFIPGVQYNASFTVGDISVTPWPSGSNRYVYYVNITSFSVAGDLGIFYLGQD